MKLTNVVCCAILSVSGLSREVFGDYLGSARAFAVLGGTTVTNTGPTTLTGSVGVWPQTSITGFPPGLVVNGTTHLGDAVAQLAQSDAAGGYAALAALTPTQSLTGLDLGGLTLTPGVYFFSSSAFLTGTLTLDAQGDPNAEFVFQIGSTLITSNLSSVVITNGADACNLYWQVGSSATLGGGSAFQGNIFASASITLVTGATLVEGRALALNGAVTLDSNLIMAGCIPAPGTAAVMAGVFTGIATRRRRTVA